MQLPLRDQQTYSTHKSSKLHTVCISTHQKVVSYLHNGATFSHALSSLCLVSTSAFSLPSDPPPGEKEGEGGSTKHRHFPPPPVALSLKTTAVIPSVCQRATELESVFMCARMWMSAQPLDWTRMQTLYCWH